jgi:putative heme-binding domain-containing protein
MEAIELLGFANDTESRVALTDALAAPSAPLQIASLNALTRRGNTTAFTNALERWPKLTTAARARAVTIALSRREFTLPLLDALQSGTIAAAQISAADAERLLSHRESAIRERARKLLGREETTRADVIEKYRPALALVGTAERGRATYQQRCATCHRLGQEGNAVGPDLASVANAGKEKLLTSILNPNAEVAAAFVAQTVETKSGETLVGLLAGENAQSITLKLANGETSQIPRTTIASLRSSNRSLMPEGLEDGLSLEQMADLLAWIASGGRP